MTRNPLDAGLLAVDATRATRHAGPCAACQHAILRGDRYAVLLNGRLIHVTCAGRLQLFHSRVNEYAVTHSQ